MSSKEQDLDKLVTLKATKVINELAEATRKEQEQRIAEFAARGILRSGGTVTMVMNLALKRMDGAARARYQAFKEVYESAGLLTADRLRERGKNEAAYSSVNKLLPTSTSITLRKDDTGQSSKEDDFVRGREVEGQLLARR